MQNTQIKIFENLEQYNKNFTKNEFYPVQKAYTTPHFLVLVVRIPGKTLGIYIGRGHSYQGIYINGKMPPSFLRIQDKWLDYIRRYIVGGKISKIQFGEIQDSYSVKFKTNHDQNELIIGYLDRKLYFARRENNLTYCSWDNQIVNSDEVEWPKNDFIKLFTPIDLEKYFETEVAKSNQIVEQKKREKFLRRKLTNILNDLEVVKNWGEIEKNILSDKYDLSGNSLEVLNQKFKFEGLKSYWEKRDLVFKKLKKLKKGESLLNVRKVEVEQEIEKVARGEFKKELTKEKPIWPIWKDSIKNTGQKSQLITTDFDKFNLNRVAGVIGLNASGNDYIRKGADKEQLWFHIENYSGAHCILKAVDITQLSSNDIFAIASMLRDYSKLDILEIPIMYTQVKNIKGAKGTPGEVIVKKCKFLRCPYINWKEIISII